ncbi:P-loop containing nucleoside triphosphate hydrolase protein [Periconia macrospinosa]|uniref:DNA 3'-5' helicase n=1 Tax=Periconia macrospinosa TaxID=97972 RepID=A0A2V1CY74_9PLEO|nr:P-loop containing nucleoside triphosphate hydrolase protein [Periconia macrospinosa]
MGLPGKEQCQWFRGSTTRPNIRYQVHDYDAEKEEEEVEALVGELKRRHPHGQVIVYCSSVAKTVRLAEVLQCVCYHRNVGSQEEKERLVGQLTSGSQQVFTATNALGLGVDAPTIRAVVHVGAVRKVRHYAQESGRAGRDGQASEAIIMRGFRVSRRGITAVPFPKDAEEEMVELIGGDGCIREVLDQAMDGREDRRGCGQGEERCQRCDGLGERADTDDEVTDGDECDEHEFEQQMSARRAQADRVHRQEAQDAMEVGRLEELMEEWKDGCQRCRAWGVRGDGHDIGSCQKEMAEEIRQGIEDFTSRKQWARFSCCFECGLPQSVCESFALDTASGGYHKQSGVDCQYGGVLVEMVFSVWSRHVDLVGDMLQAAMEQDGWMAQTEREREDGPGMGAIGRWFCEKKRWGGIEVNKMSWFIVQVMGGESRA